MTDDTQEMTEEARAERMLVEMWYLPNRFDAVVKFAAEQVERGLQLAANAQSEHGFKPAALDEKDV